MISPYVMPGFKVIDMPPSRRRMEYILQTVCAHYKVTAYQVKGQIRLQEYMVPRQVTILLCTKLLKVGSAKLGEFMGERDHTTILSSLKRIRGRIKTEPLLRAEVVALEIAVSGEIF